VRGEIVGYYDQTNIGNCNQAAEKKRRKIDNRIILQEMKTDIKEGFYLFLFKTISLSALIAVMALIGGLDSTQPWTHIIHSMSVSVIVVLLAVWALLVIGFKGLSKGNGHAPEKERRLD
jgi:uncharacterized membrane protein